MCAASVSLSLLKKKTYLEQGNYFFLESIHNCLEWITFSVVWRVRHDIWNAKASTAQIPDRSQKCRTSPYSLSRNICHPWGIGTGTTMSGRKPSVTPIERVWQIFVPATGGACCANWTCLIARGWWIVVFPEWSHKEWKEPTLLIYLAVSAYFLNK